MAHYRDRRIFVLWLGGELTDSRRRGIDSLQQTSGAAIVLITEERLSEWERTGAPFHPAFRYLSAVHKADYLRVYLMHWHGGGYSDVKATSGSWERAFEKLDTPGVWGVGYRELGRLSVAHFGAAGRAFAPQSLNWWKWRGLGLGYPMLLGCGAFAFRPQTRFTHLWLGAVEKRLNDLLPSLRAHPAQHPRARFGDGTGYPVRWPMLLSEVFHPLCLRYRPRLRLGIPDIVYTEPAPPMLTAEKRDSSSPDEP